MIGMIGLRFPFFRHLRVGVTRAMGAGLANGDEHCEVHEVFQRGATGVSGLRGEFLGLLGWY